MVPDGLTIERFKWMVLYFSDIWETYNNIWNLQPPLPVFFNGKVINICKSKILIRQQFTLSVVQTFHYQFMQNIYKYVVTDNL